MKEMYDLLKLESMVVQGIPTTASTRAEWHRSKRETTWERAMIHNLS